MWDYDRIKEEAKARGVPVTDLIALSPSNDPGELTPDYIAGLVDGEGCFELGVVRNDGGHRYGWAPRPRFCIAQRDAIPLLHLVRAYFGCGRVHERMPGRNHEMGDYMIESRIQILATGLAVLDTLPLRIKAKEYRIWKVAVLMLGERKRWHSAEVYRDYLDLRDAINPGKGRRRKVDTELLRQAVNDKERTHVEL